MTNTPFLERRALFLLPSDQMGGAEMVVRTIALEATRSGAFHRIDVLVMCKPRTGTLRELESLANVRVKYLEATTKIIGMARALRWMFRNCYALVFSSCAYINALCSIGRSLQIFSTARLVCRESTTIFERDFGFKGIAVRALYWAYGQQDLIVCQTERMRSSLDLHTRGRLRSRLVVIPNPIDVTRILKASRPPHAPSSRGPDHQVRIVWCGRLIAVKAPMRAVQTLKRLHDLGHTHFHLVMMGDGPLRNQLETTAAALSLQSSVTLLGFREDAASIMADCGIGLVTSDTEGFPNVILEMLAAGVSAVVSTDCAGDLAQIPGVRVVSEGSPDALARAVATLPVEEAVPALSDFLAMRNPASFLNQILQ